MSTKELIAENFLQGMADDDMVMISLVSRQRGVPVGQRTVEVGMYVNPEALETADGLVEMIKNRLRMARDEAAKKKHVPIHVEWEEQWFQGPFDMTRQIMEERPLIRLDWT